MVILYRNHSLSRSQVGIWSLFLAITTIFEQSKVGLLKNAHIRYVSSSDDEHEKVVIASSSFLINAAITLIFIVLIALFSNWVGAIFHSENELGSMFQWFIPGLIIMVLFSHLEAIQQSFLDFKGVFAGYFVRQIVFFVFLGGSWLLHIPYTLRNVVIYQSAGFLCGTIAIWYYSRAYLHYKFIPTKSGVIQIVQYGKYIFASGTISQMFTNLDQMMTGKFKDTSMVAPYNAALRINSLLDVPSYAAADILFPKSARASMEQEEGKVRYLFERMVGILLAFSAPIALFIILFAKPIIYIIVGSQYISAAPILQLYMITGLIRPMQNQSANLLNSIGKQAICFWMNTAALVLNLLINYACMRTIGFYGAAVGSTLSYSVALIAWWILMRKLIGFEGKNIWKYMLESYMMMYGFAIKLLRRGNTGGTPENNTGGPGNMPVLPDHPSEPISHPTSDLPVE